MNDSSIAHSWRDRCLPTAVCWAAVLGLTVGMCVEELWLPSAVIAYTNESTVTLQPQAAEPYDAFIRRAELAARASAQRSFDSDILVTDVAVTILGQNGRSIAPLLTLSVNRNQWRNQPDPRRWATYYPSAKILLGLDNTTVSSPTAVSAPAPAPASVPAIGAPTGTNGPATAPGSPPSPSSETPETPGSSNPVRIHLPAIPGGEVGLPQSVLH